MKWRHQDTNSKFLVILASSSEASINRKILKLLEDYWTSKGTVFSSTDLKDMVHMPFITNSIQVSKEVKELYEHIKVHKNLVIFTPENNSYFSAFFKNVLDWLSLIEIEFLKEKRIFLVSVSPTNKEKRAMETGIKNTFGLLGSPELIFFNFNKYKEDNDESERIEELSKQILNWVI